MAKANSEKILIKLSGNVIAHHLIGGVFASMDHTQLKHVPYRSSKLASTHVVTGIVESSCAGMPKHCHKYRLAD